MIHARYIVSAEDETYGDLYLHRTAHICSHYACRSGPYGNGVLPKGLYEIVSCFLRGPEDKSYKKDDFPWCAGIVPQFETERDDLCIHGDGWTPGTEGCIGIMKWDVYAYADIFYMLKRFNILNLEVI